VNRQSGVSALAPHKHPCAGTVWTVELTARGIAWCAFCRTRAGRGADLAEGPIADVVERLDSELASPRRRLLPTWVWLNPRVDGFCEGALDLAGPTLRAVSALCHRGIGVYLRTRGSRAPAEGLLTLARRHGAKLAVQVDLFAWDPDLASLWEQGAAPVEARLDLAEALASRGADVRIGLQPLIPFVNDDQPHLEHLCRRLRASRVRAIVPSWIQDGPGLLPQVEREVSKAAARALEGWFRMPGSASAGGRRGIAPEVRQRGMRRLRGAAEAAGLEVVACPCVDPAGQDRCLSPPAGCTPLSSSPRQLELFGKAG
jgi:hypothetical protein